MAQNRKTIVFNDLSGKISYLGFLYEDMPWDETQQDHLPITQTALDILAQGQLYKIDPSITQFDYASNITFPTDEYFKEAWVYAPVAHTVITDIPMARLIHLEELKKLRTLKWQSMKVGENLNVVFDSLFSAEDQTTLASLRNLENLDLSSYTTEATLKAYIPSYLV